MLYNTTRSAFLAFLVPSAKREQERSALEFEGEVARLE